MWMIVKQGVLGPFFDQKVSFNYLLKCTVVIADAYCAYF